MRARDCQDGKVYLFLALLFFFSFCQSRSWCFGSCRTVPFAIQKAAAAAAASTTKEEQICRFCFCFCQYIAPWWWWSSEESATATAKDHVISKAVAASTRSTATRSTRCNRINRTNTNNTAVSVSVSAAAAAAAAAARRTRQNNCTHGRSPIRAVCRGCSKRRRR